MRSARLVDSTASRQVRPAPDETAQARWGLRAWLDSAAAAGLDVQAYSGHSLRAGFVTQAKLKGKPEDAVMR